LQELRFLKFLQRMPNGAFVGRRMNFLAEHIDDPGDRRLAVAVAPNQRHGRVEAHGVIGFGIQNDDFPL
jgi:hypothetical protein